MITAESEESKPKKMKKLKVTMATGNVVVVSMETLGNDAPIMTGDAVICTGCQGALSALSKLTQSDDKKIWTWLVTIIFNFFK